MNRLVSALYFWLIPLLAVAAVGAAVVDVSGNFTAGSFNKVTITAPATSATLTIANGKTLTVSNSATITGTDAISYNLNTLTDTLMGSVGSAFSNSTAFAVATTRAAGTAVSFECVTQGAGVAGSGSAVPAITTSGGTVACSATFACNAAAGTITTGSCSAPTLTTATQYQLRFTGTGCTTNPPVHCKATWSYP